MKNQRFLNQALALQTAACTGSSCVCSKHSRGLPTMPRFYILSLRGDTIITRDFRGDVVKGTAEIFFRKAAHTPVSLHAAHVTCSANSLPSQDKAIASV